MDDPPGNANPWKFVHFFRHSCLQGTAQEIPQVCIAKLQRSDEHWRISTLAIFWGTVGDHSYIKVHIFWEGWFSVGRFDYKGA